MTQNNTREAGTQNVSMDTSSLPAAASEVLVIIAPIQVASRPSVRTRLIARAFATTFDRQIDAGALAAPGSPLAAHMNRLASLKERGDLANSLIRIVHAGPSGAAVQLFPVRSGQVDECRQQIEAIIERLRSLKPVGVQGMARLRLLICDGAGPLYSNGQGNLVAELKGVLAALA